jgi:hydrogenase maturation protease
MQPRCSNDYPRTLTAHDTGLKKLLDAFHISGDTPEIVLYSVSIDPPGGMRTELSSVLIDLVPRLAEMILREASHRP